MHKYGLLPTTPDHRDFMFRPPRTYTGDFADISDGVVKVYDQLDLGACVSNGVALAADYALRKNGLHTFGPSRLFIYWNGRVIGKYPQNQDTGLQIRDGVNSIAQFGAAPESEWVYDITKFDDEPPQSAFTDAMQHQALKFAQVQPDMIDDAIASGYPVIQGWDVYDEMEQLPVAKMGVLPMPGPHSRLLGGHCTVYVSTLQDGSEISGAVPGKKYRKNVNSWGTNWGLHGFFWMQEEYTQNFASDFWVITGMEDPSVNPPDPDVDYSREFASILHPWVKTRHTSRKQNDRVAAAAVKWMAVEGL